MSKDAIQCRMGQRIRLARKIVGLTQGELAERVGVSLTTVNAWETGKTRMVFAFVERVARALGLTTTILYEGMESPDPSADREWEIKLRVELTPPEVKAEIVRKLVDDQRSRLERTRRHIADSLRPKESQNQESDDDWSILLARTQANNRLVNDSLMVAAAR